MPNIMSRVARNIMISSFSVPSVQNVNFGQFTLFEIDRKISICISYARTTLSIPAATYATLLSFSPAMDTRELSAV